MILTINSSIGTQKRKIPEYYKIMYIKTQLSKLHNLLIWFSPNPFIWPFVTFFNIALFICVPNRTRIKYFFCIFHCSTHKCYRDNRKLLWEILSGIFLEKYYFKCITSWYYSNNCILIPICVEKLCEHSCRLIINEYSEFVGLLKENKK